MSAAEQCELQSSFEVFQCGVPQGGELPQVLYEHLDDVVCNTFCRLVIGREFPCSSFLALLVAVTHVVVGSVHAQRVICHIAMVYIVVYATNYLFSN